MYNVQMYNIQMYNVQMYNVQKYNVKKDKCTHLQKKYVCNCIPTCVFRIQFYVKIILIKKILHLIICQLILKKNLFMCIDQLMMEKPFLL